MTSNINQNILRMPQLVNKTGLSKSSIYQLIRSGVFPKPINLTGSGRAVGWHESEIDEWLANRERSGEVA